MHYILMHRNHPGKSFLCKPFLFNHQKHFDTNQGMFRKGKTKGYLNMILKSTCYKCWNFVNDPGSDLKIRYSCNYPEPTPTPHPQEVISLFFFTPLPYYGICGHVGAFLNNKLDLKWSQYLFYNFIWRTYLASRCTPWWHWPI